MSTFSTPMQIVVNANATRIKYLVPGTCRHEIFVTIPKKINQEVAYNTFKENIQKQFLNDQIYIMSIRCTQDTLYKLENGIKDSLDNVSEYTYHIIYLVISREFLDQQPENICNIDYYVGHSMNINNYLELNNAPSIDRISMHNNENKYVPFSLTAKLRSATGTW
jgi:hypothetical protein